MENGQETGLRIHCVDWQGAERRERQLQVVWTVINGFIFFAALVAAWIIIGGVGE